jgi:hypothetical protein
MKNRIVRFGFIPAYLCFRADARQPVVQFHYYRSERGRRVPSIPTGEIRLEVNDPAGKAVEAVVILLGIYSKNIIDQCYRVPQLGN